MPDIKTCLIQAYASCTATVDQIASSDDLKAQFRMLLPPELRDLGDEEIVKHLLNLRKSGKLRRKIRPK